MTKAEGVGRLEELLREAQQDLGLIVDRLILLQRGAADLRSRLDRMDEAVVAMAAEIVED